VYGTRVLGTGAQLRKILKIKKKLMNFVSQKYSTGQAQMSAWYFNSIMVLYVKQKLLVIVPSNKKSRK